MGEASADLEKSLDRLIGRLTKPGIPRAAKALLVDARRLRNVVGNWRTIAPTSEAEKEMTARVEYLERSVEGLLPVNLDIGASGRASAPYAPNPQLDVEAAVRASSPTPVIAPDVGAMMQPSNPAPAPKDASEPRRNTDPGIGSKPPPPDDRPSFPVASPPVAWDAPPSLVIPAVSAAREGGAPAVARARSAPPIVDEPTLAAPIATQAQADQERVAARSNGAPARPRSLPDLAVDAARRAPSDRPPRPTGRHAKYRVDDDAGADGGPIYSPAPAERPRSPTPDETGSRQALRPRSPTPDETGSRQAVRSSAPPVLPHSERTAIAVRPLPAPEVLDRRLVLLNDPYSNRADAYRALRRKLSGAARTIAVTSAEPGEGKTSCAVNLALAFRETSSEKVLLVEANLRAPCLAKLFGFEPPVCFAKQMAKNRDSSRASWTVVEQFEPLHILAVDPSAKTSPLLDPVAFANALEQLVEAGYDHIIVDTPPALGGSDANVIADAVDGVVVVAWIKKSKKTLVKKAIDQLKPATILGVVTLDG